MERLTYPGTKEVKSDITIKQVTDLLARYEDTGLTPEEILKLKELNTAKVPDLEGDGEYNGSIILDTWICPNCETHYEMGYDDYDFCPHCGQRVNNTSFGLED